MKNKLLSLVNRVLSRWDAVIVRKSRFGPPDIDRVLPAVAPAARAAKCRVGDQADELAEHLTALLNLAKQKSGDGYDRIVGAALLALWRDAGATVETQRRAFDIGEAIGVHVVPSHFYYPIPIVRDIPEKTWDVRFDESEGVDYRSENFMAILRQLAAFQGELSAIPLEAGARHQFYWKNSAFISLDAIAYYAMIRRFQPRRVVEVGSGYSTLLAAEAARKNGRTELECVEPYPYDWLRDLPGLGRLIEKPVQEVDFSLFTSLQENDILFVDNSHVCQVGSNVNHMVLQVLPRLRPGVLVHFHDIFLPYEMPRHWIEQLHLFWNEQYLLHAFLLFNDRFEVLLGNQLIAKTRSEEARRLFPCQPEGLPFGGVSLWLRRRN